MLVSVNLTTDEVCRLDEAETSDRQRSVKCHHREICTATRQKVASIVICLAGPGSKAEVRRQLTSPASKKDGWKLQRGTQLFQQNTIVDLGKRKSRLGPDES